MVLKVHRREIVLLLILMVFSTSACRTELPAPTAAPTGITVSPSPTLDKPTSEPPTPTPVPLAAQVNGERITLQEYQEELARYQSAAEDIGTNMATVGEQIVLDDLVSQVLLAQAAAEAGFLVDSAIVEERLDQLVLEVGGEQALDSWMADNGYTEESLAQSLARAMAAAWMRDSIISSVPQTADQVHIRQILLNDAGTAQDVLGSLSSGDNFEDLAYQYDPLMGGDLGWMPKGYLSNAGLDEAVFSLEVGQTSSVIETELGFHILQVVDAAVQRPLSPDARLVLQERALQEWLDDRRSQSEIQLLLP